MLPEPQRAVNTYSNQNAYKRQKIERSKGVQGGNLTVEKGEVVGSEVRGFSPKRANIVCPSISKNICVGTDMESEGEQCQSKFAAQACGGPSQHGKGEFTQELQGKIANSYTFVHVNDNCVASSPLSESSSLLTCESNDSFPLVDDVHVVSVDTLVDLIDDQIDSSCKINLCPPSVEAYMLNSEELACSKSSRGLDHALFRYNVLFEDDINTLNEPNGEKDGIAYLGAHGKVLQDQTNQLYFLLSMFHQPTRGINNIISMVVHLVQGPTLVSYVGSSLWAGSCSSCTGTVDQSDGNYLDDDQIADEFVQLCSPVLFTHSLMLPLRSTRRSSVAKFNIYSPTYIK
ncbi:Ferredoxin [Capsicum annuum]|nr:Ferredoxin [Capsicum annuum]